MMDSDDEILDASNVESIEDDYSADETEMGNVDDDSEPYESDDIVYPCQQQSFVVLSEHELRSRQEEDSNKVAAVLSISRVQACLLLHHFKWNVTAVHEEWFSNQENVRKAVGLLEKGIEMPISAELTCGICFEVYLRNLMSSAACNHHYCNYCWKGYIGASVGDGPGCLKLRCPSPSCNAAVGEDMVNVLARGEDKEKYSSFLLKSYVEENRKMKWCPAPGCEFAVELVEEIGNFDICCKCSHSFCWKCGEEIHRPVDCGTVAKWILKHSSESDSMNWMLANAKPCPKCQRLIEKNQGCMHMTCTPPCGFDFCWLCLQPWVEQTGRNVGFLHACNRYEAAEEGKFEESKMRRNMAKKCLERYLHYYERWTSNDQSRRKALDDLQDMKNKKILKLSKVQLVLETELQFMINAMIQVVECRRVLKWTYAYGYYLSEHEYAKRQFFEYLQGESEVCLERLHQCAEKEILVFLIAKVPVQEFTSFRTKLVGLTSVTKNYFENLVRALENGLQDVGFSSQISCSQDAARGAVGGQQS